MPQRRKRPGFNRLQVAPAQKIAKAPMQTAAPRRPQCTHMNMNRLYGHHMCYLCGRAPTVGWLYSCEQDREHEQTAYASEDSFPVVPNDSNYFDVQACLAESLGMSSSIIQGIRKRDYSFEQVDKLIEQKKHLLATIRRSESGSADSTPQLRHNLSRPSRFSENVIASVGATAGPPVLPAAATTTSANTSTDSVDNTPLKRGSKGRKQTCNFQVCHACRPFFQDRLYTSFEKVLSGRMPAITEEEITRLPMLDAAVVRTLGLSKEHPSMSPTGHSQDSMDIVSQQKDDCEEDDTSDWTPTSGTISESDSDRLEFADPYPCPGAGICPLASRFSGCAYDGDFDDGLRALNLGFGPEPDLSRTTPENSTNRLRRVRGRLSDTPGGTSSSASSISLPTPTAPPLTPLTPSNVSFDELLGIRLGKNGKAASMLEVLPSEKRRGGRFGLGIRGKDSNSSFGSEVEVEGGVALTEEAVETGTPDILTDE
ncbi:hypothetical protein LTR85_008747 [Meristemomyces frigidus]|nr:hypothetical protein LTR85_008747 [Meristemomyces frigidus]